MKRTIRLNESELKRMIAESVRRVLNEWNDGKKEIFTISAFDIENDVDVSDMQYCGRTYNNIDDAITSATEFAQFLVDYGSVVIVTVYAGEYENENGDIFGEPQDVYSVSNSDNKTTAIARKRSGYVRSDVDAYSVSPSLDENKVFDYVKEMLKGKKDGGDDTDSVGPVTSLYTGDKKKKRKIKPPVTDLIGLD